VVAVGVGWATRRSAGHGRAGPATPARDHLLDHHDLSEVEFLVHCDDCGYEERVIDVNAAEILARIARDEHVQEHRQRESTV
jgi:hypothetical protein